MAAIAVRRRDRESAALDTARLRNNITTKKAMCIGGLRKVGR
jgi:hypothetical protein